MQKQSSAHIIWHVNQCTVNHTPLVRARSDQCLTAYRYTGQSIMTIPSPAPPCHGSMINLCCRVRHWSNWAVGSWLAQKMVRIPKEGGTVSLQLIYGPSYIVTARDTICTSVTLIKILFPQKLWRHPWDLQFSSPFLHLCSSLLTPFHPGFFFNIHIYSITLSRSSPPSVLIEKCICILSLYPNNEIWDITGCGRYSGFNTQSAKHNTHLRSQEEGTRGG